MSYEKNLLASVKEACRHSLQLPLVRKHSRCYFLCVILISKIKKASLQYLSDRPRK